MKLNTLRLNLSVRNLIIGTILALFQGCAPFSIQPPAPPLDHQKIAQIISGFKEQERRVKAFFSLGTLMVEGYITDFEADVLIVGTRDPLRIKIEVTHSWGSPLYHILIIDTQLHILSFPEKRYYFGRLGSFDPSLNFFPLRLGPNQIWALVRGYPVLREYDHAVSLKGNQITLRNSELEAVQVVELCPESILPCLTAFPEQGIEVSFSDFENDKGIYRARNIRLDDPEIGAILALNLKKMVFNKSIPDAIFDLKKPSGFELHPLQGAEGE
jgi:hypothetical protein